MEEDFAYEVGKEVDISVRRWGQPAARGGGRRREAARLPEARAGLGGVG